MVNKIKKIAPRVLNLQNAVPILTIIIGVVATFNYKLLGLQDAQTAITLLLTFLVVDALVSRIGVLNDIKDNTDLITKQFTNKSTELIGIRGDFGSTEDLIKKAKKELWISGVALDYVSKLTSLFQEQTDRGVTIRFLAIDPNPRTMEDTGGYLNENSVILKSRIKNNLTEIHNKLSIDNSGKVTIKTTRFRLALGHFIVDPNEPDGYMRIETYTCHSDQTGRPMLQFFKERDPKWFDIYKKDYEKMWKNSQEWMV
jgi:hypothetical protein